MMFLIPNVSLLAEAAPGPPIARKAWFDGFVS